MSVSNPSPIWLPKLHPKQQFAYDTDATEILYGGSTRGGKSHFVRHALIMWSTLIPGLQCDIFRLNFDDVIGNHMQGETGFPVMLAQWERDKIVTITQTEVRFNFNGSLISLEHCSDDRALRKHQGIPKHVRVFEESTQFPEDTIRYLRSWVAMSELMQSRVPESLGGPNNRFPRLIYTSNPIGVSAGYFRKGFVKARPRMTTGYAPESDGGHKRIYIPALVEDNPSEDAEATRRRVSGIGDDALTDALLNENWDAPVGEFFPQYDDKRHAVPDFDPPKHWFKFITFDWGSAEPFAVLWWAVSDGVEFTGPLGEKRWYPRSSIIAYREWYGCDGDRTAKGCEMRNPDIAKGISLRTVEETSGLVVTDSLPFQDRGMARNGRKYKIADVFRENGCPLILGNTARITGWAQVRDRLIGVDDFPLIYFTESCKHTREYIPQLGRSKTRPEDAAESGEATHLLDCVRLACTTRPIVIDNKAESKEFRKTPMQTPERILKQLKKKSYG